MKTHAPKLDFSSPVGEVTALSSHIKNPERVQTNDLIMQLKNMEKQEQINLNLVVSKK